VLGSYCTGGRLFAGVREQSCWCSLAFDLNNVPPLNCEYWTPGFGCQIRTRDKATGVFSLTNTILDTIPDIILDNMR